MRSHKEILAEMKIEPSYGLGYTDGLMAVSNEMHRLMDEKNGSVLYDKLNSFILKEMIDFYTRFKDGRP